MPSGQRRDHVETVAANTLMPMTNAGSGRAASLFQEAEHKIYLRTDRLFARLMIFQWLAGIVAAVWISPQTWIGSTSYVHWHVWAAIFLGGAILGEIGDNISRGRCSRAIPLRWRR